MQHFVLIVRTVSFGVCSVFSVWCWWVCSSVICINNGAWRAWMWSVAWSRANGLAVIVNGTCVLALSPSLSMRKFTETSRDYSNNILTKIPFVCSLETVSLAFNLSTRVNGNLRQIPAYLVDPVNVNITRGRMEIQFRMNYM